MNELRAKRKQRGWTRAQLASVVHLTAHTIYKLETGRIRPSAETLERLADALDCSTDELLGRRAS